MAATRSPICIEDFFNRGATYSTTPGVNGWTLKITGTTPTIAPVDGGGVKLTLTSTSEAQICTLYQNDVLPIPLLGLQKIRFNALCGGIDNVTTIVMGVASAYNATQDSVATNAWVRLQGSASLTALVAETDDGTTDTDDVATAQTLTATSKEIIIDFTKGPSDIRFSIDGAPVALSTTFSMAAATSSTYVQPYFQLAKASGTGVPTITIEHVKIDYVDTFGA